MDKVICHIVGLNNFLKQKFISYLAEKYSNIVVKDLDDITNNIRNNKKMITFYDKLSKVKLKKNKIQLVQQINTLWKKSLINNINRMYKKNHDKKIILLGLCTYHKNHKLRIKIDTKNKFFIKIDDKKNAINIVEYNIDIYRKNIINGSFPLRYIDHQFLMKQRIKLKKIYTNMNYKLKSYQSILKWIDLKMEQCIAKDDKIISGGALDNNKNIISKQIFNNDKVKVDSTKVFNNNIDDKKVYVGSSKNYNSNIKIKKNYRKDNLHKILGVKNKNYITGYTKKWLAILSSIKDNNTFIKKGYLTKNNKIEPYIQEKYDNSFDKLKTACYLYECDNKNFNNNVGWYKYQSTKNVDIIENKFISNIYDELINQCVKMIKFKK